MIRRRVALGDDLAAVLAPAPGPMSTILQSAVRIICSSCSTTITVLPGPPPQPLERADQLVVVALVEADRRLRRGCTARRRARASRSAWPAASRCASPPEKRPPRRGRALEVADAHVVEEGEAARGSPLRMRSPIRRSVSLSASAVDEAQPRAGSPRAGVKLVDVEPAHGDRKHLGLEARAVARRAGPERHVLLDALAHLPPSRSPLSAALEVGDDALESRHVGAPATHPVAVTWT